MSDTFEESRSKYEPLRTELRPFLEKTKFGWFIRHPFANESIRDLKQCAWIHDLIDERTAKADACFEAQDWEGYLDCIEIFSQPVWFAKDAHLFPDDRFWSVLGRVYGTQKYTHYYRDLFESLFRSDRPGRENLMSLEEREAFARLPEELTVYRGYSDDDWEDYAEGIAWTLDRRQAVWYANWTRKSDNPRVITGKVRKADVWAYFHGGDILLPPEMVYARRDRRAWCKKARVSWVEYVKPPFSFEKFPGKA